MDDQWKQELKYAAIPYQPKNKPFKAVELIRLMMMTNQKEKNYGGFVLREEEEVKKRVFEIFTRDMYRRVCRFMCRQPKERYSD